MRSKSNFNKYGIVVLFMLALVSTVLLATVSAQVGGEVACPVPDAVLITEYPIPTADSEPSGITVGPDGTVWFGEDVGSIGRITVDGEITEYPLPDAHYARRFPVAGPDGAIWFTDPVPNVIGRITPEGGITTYAIPSGVERYDEDLNLTFTSSYPVGIALGADQAIWFTELDTSQIGHLSMEGEFTEYPTPTADSGPVGITLGPDGAIWFIERSANQIGRITTDGEITEYPVPTPESFLLRLTGGPDGAVWFTEFNGNKIGRISMDGEFTEFVLPTSESGPVGITAGLDTAIWFTEFNANKIGCITPEGKITEYEIPTPDSAPFNIVIGADGAIWFTENASGKIGRLQVQAAQTTFSPERFEFPLSLTYNLEWYVQEDYSDVVTLRMFKEPTVDLAFLTLENASIAGSEAPYAPVLFPDNFVTWIQAHGLFRVDSTRPVLIDGFQGTEINVTATSACGNKRGWIFFSRTGWNCGEGEFLRFIYLNDVRGEHILILITGGPLSGDDLDVGLDAAQAIIDSATFSTQVTSVR
jgi:virginiamycin B lyase